MATTDETEQPTPLALQSDPLHMPFTIDWARRVIDDTVDDFLKHAAQQPEDSPYRMPGVGLDTVVTVAITLKWFLHDDLAERRENHERWQEGGATKTE